ncbi:MAG: SPFH domain-containing protein [Ignavibacteria bacterium]|nr:SPFH domain-containing protein [Ignavibacteria bacterium]
MEGFTIFLLACVVIFFFSTFRTVAQGTIGVVTTFGKYRRIMMPGLNFKLPFIETIYKRISIQNRSAELEFQAITSDQATVQFKALLLFAVLDQQEETIKNVAFKFVDEKNFMQTLVRTVEGSVRSFVASQKQAEILGSRTEIVNHVKHQIDQTLEMWGYHLIDMQMNDIAFDSAIMKSMAQVVASNNLKAAAENEGQALLITKTKQAEAEGNAIKIAAAAEKDASQLRGQGISLFREEAAKGMSQAIKQLEGSHIDASVILFSMWTETIRHLAEHGKGNVIFLDGSVDGMEHSIKQLLAMNNGGLWKGNTPT